MAVDLGLRTGLALYRRDGRLLWYRSTNFGSVQRLRRGLPGVFAAIANPVYVVLEGGGPLAKIWERACAQRHIELYLISAETWRPRLLLPREQRSRSRAKHSALDYALNVIEWSDAPRPTAALGSDAAEAILIGLWGVVNVGWLDQLPSLTRRRCR
ncbi:MAG: hypothetical protein ACFCBW_19165 [Candidatus Competibacterales bacterium]